MCRSRVSLGKELKLRGFEMLLGEEPRRNAYAEKPAQNGEMKSTPDRGKKEPLI